MFDLIDIVYGQNHPVLNSIATNGYADLEGSPVLVVLAISGFEERLEVRHVSGSRSVTILKVMRGNVVQSPRIDYPLVKLMNTDREQQRDY